MATPSHPTSCVVECYATTPVNTGGRCSGPSAWADMGGSPEPLHQLVSMALAVSVVLGNHVGFAPFLNGNWRAVEGTPPPI
jgi:hypothetical protein